MKNLKWYFPESLDEAHFLKSKKKSVFHSGGTGLRRIGLDSQEAIIDTSKLPIGYFEKGNQVLLGGGLTFAESVTMLTENNCCPLLVKSLNSAANTPLRNRITMGGSLGAMHVWSDLIGPLLALNANVYLYKGHEDMINVDSFLTDRQIRENALISKVSFMDDYDDFYYYRETRTVVDYPAFTISMVIKNGKVSIALTGSKNRFERLAEIEEAFNNGEKIEDCLSKQQINFAGKPHGSAEYLENSFKVALERGLRSVKK